MKRKRRPGPILLALLLAALTAGAARAAGEATLTILATSDLHGHLYNWDFARGETAPLGLASVAAIVAEERAQDPALLLVDAGDTLQGSPLVYYYNTRLAALENPMATAMNALRYDAMTLGNHDFDFGLKTLDKFIREARFPVLSANIRAAGGGERFRPYALKTVKGVKVGILGLTTPGIPQWVKPEHIAGLRFDDAVETAAPLVAELRRAGAQVVLALAHAGPHLQPVENDSAAWRTPLERWVDKGYGAVPEQNFVIPLAQRVAGLDVIVSGHTHLTVPEAVINGVLLTQPSYWGRGVAKVTLTLGADGRVTGKRSEFLAAEGREPDRRMLTLTRPCQDKALAYVNTAVGTAVGDFPGGAEARRADGPLADLIHAVQLEMARQAGCPADASAATLFNNAARLPKGPIRIADLYTLYPYENTLWVLEITGAGLKAALEQTARYWAGSDAAAPTPDPVPAPFAKPYSWDMYSGIEYEIDLSRPVGERVTVLRWQGADLRPEQTLKLAVNNFRAVGGGGYRMFREAKVLWRGETEIREALVEHVAARRRLDPRDYFTPNWRLATPGAAETGP